MICNVHIKNRCPSNIEDNTANIVVQTIPHLNLIHFKAITLIELKELSEIFWTFSIDIRFLYLINNAPKLLISYIMLFLHISADMSEN